MNPAMLDYLLSLGGKDGWVCPKCGHAMHYQPVASTSYYVCRDCSWLQHDAPQRGKVKRTA